MALVNLFVSSSVKEELASPNPGKKNLPEDVGRGEGCLETLANYSQVQGHAKTVQKRVIKMIYLITCSHT
jgi:hypothetical protein